MQTVNMHYAKTHLSRLVEAASKGESFVIARAGKPLVRVEALVETSGGGGGEDIILIDGNPIVARRFGGMIGKMTYSGDIKTAFKDEIEDMFYGEAE